MAYALLCRTRSKEGKIYNSKKLKKKLSPFLGTIQSNNQKECKSFSCRLLLWVRCKTFSFSTDLFLEYDTKNKRERARNATCIIQMSGQSTTITNPEAEGEEKTFNFDHSYWSHDGAKELEDGYFAPEDGANYIGQVGYIMGVCFDTCLFVWEFWNSFTRCAY